MKRKESPLIVLDEADKLSDQVLYFFISLYKQLEDHCGIILTATSYLRARIEKGLRLNRKGYAEIFSRIGRKFVELPLHNSEDVARKQVIAAIGAWLRETGQEETLAKIKGIAERASGYSDFNKIPRERLRNLIATFNNKVKDARAVDALTDAMLMQHYAAPKSFDPTNN